MGHALRRALWREQGRALEGLRDQLSLLPVPERPLVNNPLRGLRVRRAEPSHEVRAVRDLLGRRLEVDLALRLCVQPCGW